MLENFNKSEGREKGAFKKHKPVTDRQFTDCAETWPDMDREKIIEKWIKSLNEFLENISKKINKEYSTAINNNKEERSTILVDNDCVIRMNSFQKSEGGPYSNEYEEFKNDKEYVRDLEEIWKEEGQEKEKSYGDLWEKAITVILNRIISDKFIVVRASKYDDYKNKIDTVIIDKETGNVVCAFDDASPEEGTRREAEKREKIEEKNKKGGANIKYGITVGEGNKIIKKEINNIPIFYLRLYREDLINLLNKMNFKNEEPSDIEIETFNNLVKSLKEQMEELKSRNIATGAMKDNLEKFEYSLEKIMEINNHKQQQ